MSHAAEKVLHQTVDHLRQEVARLGDQVRLLSLENEDLLQQLKDAGVPARLPVLQAERLPPPLTEPDAAAIAEADGRLTGAERRLRERLCSGQELVLLLPSDTTTDVGLWIVPRRVWVAVTRAEVVLFAAGRRPLAQRVAFEHLYASLYNAITGELVFAPNREYRVARVKLPPLEGTQVLAQIYGALAPRKEGSA